MATNGTIKVPEIATPDTPASGYARVYVGTNKKLNVLGDDGVVRTVDNIRSLGITIDGGGVAITTGVKGYIPVPYSGTITAWTLIADVSGSIVIDVWKDTYANYPPTVADTIAGSEKPTLSSAQKNQDTSLTTWTTTVTAGDILGFNVDSASTVTNVTLLLSLRVS